MAHQNTTGHLLAELERIARILDGYRTTLERRERPSQPVDTDATPSPDPADLPLAIPEDAAADVDARAKAIDALVAEATGTGPRFAHVVETFDLSANHRDVLLLALLPVAYPHYQEVVAELQNDLSATQPTVGLIADLFSETDSERLAATGLVGPDSPLREHSLVSIGEPDDTRLNRTERPVFVEDRIESYLLGHDGIDPVLADVLERVPAETTLAALRLDDTVRERLRTLAAATGGASESTGGGGGGGRANADDPRRLYWYGPPGTGKREAVEVLVPTDGFLRVDLPAVFEAGLLGRLRREVLLLDRPLHLHSVTRATGDDPTALSVDDIFETFDALSRPLVVTGREEWTPNRSSTTAVDAIVEFPRPSFAVRRQFWADHAEVLSDELDPAVLAGTFKLTQGDLETALATARSLADGETLDPEDVYEGCSAQSAGELSDLAEQLDPAATWDDIELREETMRDLRTVAAHVTNQGLIYAEWAFEERFSRGTGVVALFSGPSGTGKTMAAEILATETGMELYKIDLSSVVSKYIGETEENLEQIFTEAEHSNAVLLFDEADAVFGDRASVSDATDRYANVEVNYLLQRIESYDGVVLLTTNYESNIDSAFMRRIDHSVSFKRPQEETRREIWENIFPEETPVEGVDYEFLASFSLTGGDIRTIAQTSAILAAADGSTVEMKHIVRGLQQELQKAGKMVNPQEFEPYRDHLHRGN
jgi:AAA+ superfamily predicted ATPase